jgi:hypothetical protein
MNERIDPPTLALSKKVYFTILKSNLSKLEKELYIFYMWLSLHEHYTSPFLFERSINTVVLGDFKDEINRYSELYSGASQRMTIPSNLLPYQKLGQNIYDFLIYCQVNLSAMSQ